MTVYSMIESFCNELAAESQGNCILIGSKPREAT